MKTEKNILIAFLLNISFSILEFIGGLITGSIAIATDSIHDLGDALSIGISYLLEKKSKQQPDKNHTYGYIKYSLIGSIITTMILLFGSIFVIYESIKRILHPIEVNYNGMLLFAIFGIITNFIASYVTKEGDSLNQKSVNLHMLEDVLGWVVVFLGSILMKFTNISVIDPVLSIAVALLILTNTIKNLKEILDVFLETTPKEIDIDEFSKEILKIKGVKDVHHIHVRSIDGFKKSATLHIVVDKYNEKVKKEVRRKLQEKDICHSTIELELLKEKCEETSCHLESQEHIHVHSH